MRIRCQILRTRVGLNIKISPDGHIWMKLWTEARLLHFLSRLSQPSTSSAPLPPTPTIGIADPPGSGRLLHLLVRKPGLVAWIDFSAPIHSGERRWTVRPVSLRSWFDTDPKPCLGFTTVLCLLSRRLFWRIRFLFFSGCLGRRSWNRRRSGMCCDVSAQILVFRIPCHLSIFVERGLLLPQQIALYLHDTETLMYCIHSHASLLLWFQYFGIE